MTQPLVFSLLLSDPSGRDLQLHRPVSMVAQQHGAAVGSLTLCIIVVCYFFLTLFFKLPFHSPVVVVLVRAYDPPEVLTPLDAAPACD